MSNLYGKSPAFQRPDASDPTQSSCDVKAADVTGIKIINNGFNAGFTEGLCVVLDPSAANRTAVKATTDFVELTESQWAAAKPDYEN